MSSDDPLLGRLDDRIAAQAGQAVDGFPAAGRQTAGPPTEGAARWARRTPHVPSPLAGRRGDAPADQQDAVLGTAALMHYLDAEFELSRRRTDDGIDRLLQALTAIDARLATLEAFREGLFSWLDSYVSWEASTLTVINDHISAVVAARPQQPGTAPPAAP